jgi:hypothetical protein
MGDDTMKEKEEINWFTRIMVILLALFIVFVIVMKLFYYKTPFEIDEYIIICLLILSILVLSESYNSFSIGKIFSLNKKVEEKEKTNQELKKENSDLREQITNIVNKISVNQQFNFGDFKLSHATEEDKKEKKQAEQEEIKTLVNDNETINNKDQDKRAKAFMVSESLALKEFSKELPPDVSLDRNL